MKARVTKARSRRGYILLEVILATMVFSIAVTGLVIAVHKTADAAEMGQNEMKVQRILKSALTEAVSLPTLEEGKISSTIEEKGMEIVTETIKLDEIKNKDDQPLQEMYKIRVTAYWIQNNQKQEISAETLRYGRLYQP